MFYNHFTEKLYGEKNSLPWPHIVRNAHYSPVRPQPAPQPQLIHFSRQMAEYLGLSDEYCRSDEFVQMYSGNFVPASARPYASCYGGHQFGVWAGQLGDGRVVNLGEVKALDGSLWTAQLKGAGPTPYSRTADGYAVLRSSLREYLCSEAMFALGVPTTRALSLCLTGRSVVRDIFYQGDPRPEPGAVVCRLSRSFLRFGHFEIFSSRGDVNGLRHLLDFSIRENFPQIAPILEANPTQAYLDWFAQVCASTAVLVAHWLRVGFVHGVLNSDNMSVLGETIDYGPYGWIEEFDPLWTPNTTDTGKRYCFAMQGKIAQWNLWCLANAVSAVAKDTQALEDILNGFGATFWQQRLKMMRGKLGLSGEHPDDAELCDDFEDFMCKSALDMTLFFHHLSQTDCDSQNPWLLIEPLSYRRQALSASHRHSFEALMKRYFARLNLGGEGHSREERQRLMNSHNPVCVPRNYLSQLAIDAAGEGDFEPLRALFKAVTRPYERGHAPTLCRMSPTRQQLSCSS